MRLALLTAIVALAAGLTACRAAPPCVPAVREPSVPAPSVGLGGLVLGAGRDEAEARCLSGIGAFTVGQTAGHCSKLVTPDVPLVEGEPIPDVALDLDRAGRIRALRVAYPLGGADGAAAREAVYVRIGAALGDRPGDPPHCRAGQVSCLARWSVGDGEVQLRGRLAGGRLHLELDWGMAGDDRCR